MIKTFKRNEIKYILSQEQYETVTARLKNRMIPDPYCKDGGTYMIYNLYFDTDDNAVIRRSLSKPYYKEKLRLRSYKIPSASHDLVFLELKKKIGGTVAKRRAELSYGDALAFITWPALPETGNYQDLQVLSEISAFLESHPVRPKVYISYERTAFFDREDREFRISFDHNILTRRNELSLMSGDFGSQLLDEEICLMEVKCGQSIPIWLCHLLSELHVFKTRFSKYGTEYQNYENRKEIIL